MEKVGLIVVKKLTAKGAKYAKRKRKGATLHCEKSITVGDALRVLRAPRGKYFNRKGRQVRKEETQRG